MKKLTLLLASCALALGANAQLATTSAVRLDHSPIADGTKGINPEKVNVSPDMMRQLAAAKAQSQTASKGTLAGSRWYNYVDHLAIINQGIYNNDVLPYMWNKPNMYGVYQGTTGLVRDTITLYSMGFVFHPYFSEFNDPAAYTPGSFGISQFTNYNVDSISVYGFYGRNPAKTNVVDTLRFALVYGNGGTSNIELGYYTAGTATSHGVDTLRSALLKHDTVRNTAGKIATGGPILYKDVILTPNSVNDTIAGGVNRFSVSTPNFSVPAGNLVGVSVTFKSGENPAPFSDTVFRGSVNPTVPFKYGMFRPLFYEENAGGFASYTKGNYNSGQLKTFPNTNYEDTYVPHWAYTSPDYPNEFPYIEVKLSSANGVPVGVKNLNTIGQVSAYPNPANNTLSIPVTLKAEGDITVNITNVMGQVVKSQNLGKASANQTKTATFNTSDLAAGVYMYVVESNGQRVTNRVMIAH